MIEHTAPSSTADLSEQNGPRKATDTPVSEPIAIVGIGCRFAGGVTDPASYWQMLTEGRDGLIEVPPDRWAIEDWFDADRDAPGKMNFRRAGFLRDGIDRFDAGFFGIAPREAAQMDPQQRLFLELAHEALEDAGLPSDRLTGQACGVFAGGYFGNYPMMTRGAPSPDLIDGWSATGGHSSVVAGRLAYYLGTTGPALMVDTACSSSLVAVHLAVQSLRLGECDMALCGGVHLLSAPEPLVASTKLGATAPDGQCKVFDAGADGFGHGEGGALLVLKRLSDAQQDGDRVIALIRGTAVNQDGRSNSLTAPNGPAQERVIRAALRDAGVAPEDVSYVETHGTGTALGDPIEVEALGHVLAQTRSAPLMIGSVKGNIGHTEAAAGIAGLLKAALVARHGHVPPQCGFSVLNEEIAALEMAVKVPTTLCDLRASAPPVVGVSAFGFSGTNAHAILQAPPQSDVVEPVQGPEIVAISARSPEGLDHAITEWCNALHHQPEAFSALARTSTAGRKHWPHRVAVGAESSEAAIAALSTAKRFNATHLPRIGFLFTGQGSQYSGMAQALYGAEPVFRAALDGHFATLDALCGWDSRALMFGTESLEDTAKAQPLLVAIELALASLWASVGIKPAAVMGHSVGEISAAAVSGAIREEDALRFAVARGAAMQALPKGGGMLAVFASENEVAPLLDRIGQGLGLAALNAPLNTVAAGPSEALSALAQLCKSEGLDTRPLSVSHAFHSSLIAPALPDLQAAAETMAFETPQIPLLSNVTATPLLAISPEYWCDHALNPVRFADSLQAMQALGVDLCVEIGPDAVLTGLSRMVSPDLRCLPSLRRSRPDGAVLAQTMADLYTLGAPIDWSSRKRGLAPISAPLTRFQRTRHWLEVPAASHRATLRPTANQQAPDPVEAEQGSALIYDFYDELTVISQNYNDAVDGEIHEEGHLTFGLLPAATTGFSWVRALFEKDLDPQGHALLRQTQGALKEAIFADLDFSGIQTIFDYGCGHAADLASLVLEHPHLRGRGYTLSAGQVEVGRRRLAALGLSDRIRVDRADSAKTAFPTQTDLIFGVEVTGLIGDKDGLFANIANGLADGGLLVIADFIATQETIANPDTHSYTPVAEEWAELMGRHKLRLVRALDASAPVARWLDDPEFAQNIDALVARYGLSDLTKRHLLSNGNIGNALRADLMRYILMRAVHSPRESVAAVTQANLDLLQNCPVWQPEQSADLGWTYKLQDTEAPLRPSLDTTALVEAASETLQTETTALANHAGAGAAVDALAQAYLQSALQELGVKTVQDAATAPVAPRHMRLLRHLIKALDPDTPHLSAADLAERHQSVAAQVPAAAAELCLLERCGTSLAAVLRDEVDPLDLLFPNGNASDAEALYERSPFSAALQRLAAKVCAAIPRDQALNVIEIGGGTGATTAHIRPHLPTGSDYLFTDLAPALVERARDRFDGARFDALPYNIETPPTIAGLATGQFDLTVAANVLHATQDLHKALSHVHDLLSPGGLLLLVENTGPFLWGDLTFGLTPGMWAFDEGARDHALFSSDAWRVALEKAGFTGIQVLDPGHDDIAQISRQCLIIAQKTATRRFALHGDPQTAAELAPLLVQNGHEVVTEAQSASDIVYLATGTQNDTAPDLITAVHNLLPQDPMPLITLVAGADPICAGLQGFARGIAAEYPESLARAITLAPDLAVTGQTTALSDAVLHTKGDIWLDGATPTSRALQPTPLMSSDLPSLSATGCYLVTGAFGGLGPHLVRWLHGRGARRFVLAGRRLPDQATRDALSGFDVHLEIADLSDPAAPARLVTSAEARGGLRGIFHAAGALSDGALSQQTPKSLALPFAAKGQAVTALAQATDGMALDHFVVFSSVAGLLAPFGQANHAAAATNLAAIAEKMNASGRPVLCIDWGAFAQAGAAMQPGVQEKVAKTGLGFMPPEAAFDRMGRAMMSGETDIVIVDADWAQYATRYPKGGVPYLLKDLVHMSASVEPPAPSVPNPKSKSPQPSAEQGWYSQLESTAPSHRSDRLHDLIRAEAARILHLPESELRDDAPLREAGLDSLMSIEFRNALSLGCATKLGATLVFDHPSIRDLAAHLASVPFVALFSRDTDSAPEAKTAEDLESYDADELSRLLAAELNDALGAD